MSSSSATSAVSVVVTPWPISERGIMTVTPPSCVTFR